MYVYTVHMRNNQQGKRMQQVTGAVTQRRDKVCANAPTSTIIKSELGDKIYVLSERCRQHTQKSRRLRTMKQQYVDELRHMGIVDRKINVNAFSNLIKEKSEIERIPYIYYYTCALDGLVFMKSCDTDRETTVQDKLNQFFRNWEGGSFSERQNPQAFTFIKAQILMLLA